MVGEAEVVVRAQEQHRAAVEQHARALRPRYQAQPAVQAALAKLVEELGLNVARQPDNGANPRPDNRSGWLDGDTPQTPIDELIDRQDEAPMWDPATQLRHRKKTSVPPRPDGAPNAFPEVVQVAPSPPNARAASAGRAG